MYQISLFYHSFIQLLREKGPFRSNFTLVRHSINSEKTDFVCVQNNINICHVANEINGCITQFNTLGFLSCAEVVGGKKEHGTVSRLRFSRCTMHTITPTHMLVRAYSSHLSQNATSVSTHFNLPTYRLCAAPYVKVFLYNTVHVASSHCHYQQLYILNPKGYYST